MSRNFGMGSISDSNDEVVDDDVGEFSVSDNEFPVIINPSVQINNNVFNRVKQILTENKFIEPDDEREPDAENNLRVTIDSFIISSDTFQITTIEEYLENEDSNEDDVAMVHTEFGNGYGDDKVMINQIRDVIKEECMLSDSPVKLDLNWFDEIAINENKIGLMKDRYLN